MSATTLGLIGTTHDPDLRRQYHYPLSLLEQSVRAFRPDVILGEVMPESWALLQQDIGYDAPDFMAPASEYYDLIFPFCAGSAIPFVPIDWCEPDVWHHFDPFKRLPSDERQALMRQFDLWDEKIRATWDQSPIPFNSAAYDALARSKYEWIREIDPESIQIQWTCRNAIMAQRIENAARRYAGSRLLVVAGADHNYILADHLQHGPWNFRYPLGPVQE